jgi:hypothetical protein
LAAYALIPAKIIASGLKLIALCSFKLCTDMLQIMPLAILITAAEAKLNPERKK